MDHLEATSAGATERYLLGTLDRSEREAFEEHFFDCLECAEDVRAAAALLAGARSLPEVLPAGLTDIARARAAATARRTLPRFLRGRGFTAALGGLAVAACFTVVYQGLVVIPRLEGDLRQADSIQPVSSHFLTMSRSEAEVLEVGPADRHVALTLSRSWDEAFPSYRCELEDASGKVLLAETLPSRSSGDELELLLPVQNLPAGSYVLVIEGVRPGYGAAHGNAPLARYSFNLQRGRSTNSADPSR
jgi:hypothetical protein